MTTATTTGTSTTIVTSKKFDTGSISKLNGDNFRVWKVRMTSLFLTHNIMGVVDGTLQRPPASAAADQVIWDQNNNEALTSLYFCMKDEEVEAISGCQTAHDIWVKLNTMYQSISGESKQVLWQRYYSIMAVPGKSAVKTMVEIQNYASQLRSMGAIIDEEMEVARVISSLIDERYRQLREAWRSVDSGKQSTALLLSRLKTWELEEIESTKSVTSTSTTSDESDKAYLGFQGRGKGKPKKTKEELAELKKRTKCHLCKVKGHWRSECPDKDTDKKQVEKVGGAYVVGVSKDVWINDSGANRHYCGRLDWYFEYVKYSTPKPVGIADNSYMFVEGVGKVRVKAFIQRQWKEIEIHNVEYVPGGANLFSENVLLDKGFHVRKEGCGDVIYYKNGLSDVEAERRDGLQIMKFKPIINRAMACVKQVTWHERLAHINGQYLRRTAEKTAAHGLENMLDENFKCEICLQAKSKRQSYKSVEKTEHSKPGECLHSDLVHATVTSFRGNKYFLLIKDEETSFRLVYFQKDKTDTVKNLKDAVHFLSNQTGNTVKMFRSDNGSEYVNHEWKEFMSEKGIQFGLNAPYTSQSNGLIEREVRTEQEAARAMLLQSQLSEQHWDDAIRTACYILNRTLSSKNTDVTPFEMIFKKKPSLHHVRIFGCKAYALVSNASHHNKWDSKAVECILVGYNASSKNYLLYIPNERRYIEQAKHVDFVEGSMALKGHSTAEAFENLQITVSNRQEDTTPIIPKGKNDGEEHDGEENDEDKKDGTPPSDTPNLVAASPRKRRETHRRTSEFPRDDDLFLDAEGDELFIGLTQQEQNESWGEEMEREDEEVSQLDTTLSGRPKRSRQQVIKYQAGQAHSACCISTPERYLAAVQSRESDDWKEAMDSEIRSQTANGTWKLVRRPDHGSVLKNRWVYKLKLSATGQVDRFKARLVVKGFTQREGLDYNETFAPVCRYETIRVMLSIAAKEELEIIQFDIATAFLNSTLKETIFMEQPEGYVVGNSRHVVCKLEKGLYGLKQAPRASHETLKTHLATMDFFPLESDSCLFKKNNNGDPIFLVIYVDDGLLIGSSLSALRLELTTLEGRFKLSVQPFTRFLGVEIERNSNGIFLHQKRYIQDLLTRFNMSECKTLDTPMQPGLQLEGSSPAETSYAYQELVGCLLFLTRCTRPDIAYSVHYMARFFSNYGKSQWTTAKKILQYLKGTQDYGILYKTADLNHKAEIIGYVDADYGADQHSRKSTTGCLFTYNAAPIVWLSKRQTCIALSSTESEYIALAHAGKESVWLARLFSEITGSSDDFHSVCLRSDSQSAIRLAKNPEHHDKTKHIAIRHHYIRRLVETSQVTLEHLPDLVQPADLLTKSVSKEVFVRKRNLMGVQPPKEGGKRKAMSSVIVDPKRPHLFWSLALLLFLGLVVDGSKDVHTTGSAVLWKKTHDPVIVGVTSVITSLLLVNPCDLLPVQGVEVSVANAIETQCRQLYTDLFLSNLEKLCPPQTLLRANRVKRQFDPVSAGIILVGIVASAGIGLGGYAVSQTYKLNTRQEELKVALNDLERKVFTASEKHAFLQGEVKKVTSVLDQLVVDFTLYRTKVVELQYLIAYLTGRLMEGRKALKETAKAWKKGELTSDFFDFLNFTLPCAEDCPVDHGIYHSCHTQEDKREILMDFSVPIINRNLTRVEAESFDLMHKKDNMTCSLVYAGPKVATVSLDEDCVYRTQRTAMKNKIGFGLTQKCSNSTLVEQEKLYRIDKCQASQVGDEQDFIQIKIFNDQYHIYCPYSKYIIGKRKVQCPNKVFTLPLSITFSLNGIEYKGDLLKIVYRETEDPILMEYINWHLNPRLNWSNFSAEFEVNLDRSNKQIAEEAGNLAVFEFHDHTLSVAEILLILVGVTAVFCIMGFAVLRCFKKPVIRAKDPKDQENIELQQPMVLQSPAPHHQIIIHEG